jgi:hypothetical protein
MQILNSAFLFAQALGTEIFPKVLVMEKLVAVLGPRHLVAGAWLLVLENCRYAELLKLSDCAAWALQAQLRDHSIYQALRLAESKVA